MTERVAQEIRLLTNRFPDLECSTGAGWICIPNYPVPAGWNTSPGTRLVFPVPPQYPGTPPYGIYVPIGIRFGGQIPTNYTEPAPAQPPFSGTWAVFSWTFEEGSWRPAAEVTKGSNLLNWVIGFQQRFKEGV